MEERSFDYAKCVAFIDFETTGLDAETCEVVESAVLIAEERDGALVEFELHEQLWLPSGEIPAAASEVHGLTRAVLEASGARPFSEEALGAWLLDTRLLASRFLFAHYADFDVDIATRCASAFMNARVPGFENVEYDVMCSRGLAKSVWPDLESYRLTELVAELQLDVPHAGDGVAHRAAYDCRATLALVNAAAQKARGWEVEA